MSFAVFTNMFGLALLTLFVPILTIYIGHAGLLGIFAGLNVLAFILVFFFVRETAGAGMARTPGSLTFLNLEELGYVFGVPTATYVNYQIREMVPWAWRYYVLRDLARPEPKPLYTWARAIRRDASEALEPQVHVSQEAGVSKGLS